MKDESLALGVVHIIIFFYALISLIIYHKLQEVLEDTDELSSDEEDVDDPRSKEDVRQDEEQPDEDGDNEEEPTTKEHRANEKEEKDCTIVQIKYNLFATDGMKKAMEDLETKKLSRSYGKSSVLHNGFE